MHYCGEVPLGGGADACRSLHSWEVRHNAATCLRHRGFGTKKNSAGQSIDFERVHAALVAPALKRCDLAGDTTIEVVEPGNIRADMFALIVEADIVVCDITVHNANVFYELGIRHSLRKKHTVLIKGDPSADTTPFDLSTDRYLKYPVANPGAALEALVRLCKLACAASTRPTARSF